MRNISLLKSAFLFILAFTLSCNAFAWGPKGHTMIVQLAMKLVKPEVKQNVLDVLAGMPLDSAANWMDIVRSNSDYDFMKPWHYIDFPEGDVYQPSTDENIVNRLIITYNELRHKKVLCNEQIKMDLLILIHLMGDLHQPLHTAYEDDLGGNKRAIQYNTLKTNLHHFWDEDMVDLSGVKLDDFEVDNKFAGNLDTVGIHPALWMKESRTLLNQIYDFPDFTIDNHYINKNKYIVKTQIAQAAIRLAAMLNKLFQSTAPTIDAKILSAKYKDGIEAKDAMNFIGKQVTICSRVYGIKTIHLLSIACQLVRLLAEPYIGIKSRMIAI